MTIQRMDHVGVVVDDLEAATAFFVELGMGLEGEAPVEGRWVDRVVGLDDVRVDIAMMRTPDGHGRIELTKFHTPTAISAEPKNAPANTLGMRRIMFAVEGIEDVLARLHTHDAELVGEQKPSAWPGTGATSSAPARVEVDRIVESGRESSSGNEVGVLTAVPRRSGAG